MITFCAPRTYFCTNVHHLLRLSCGPSFNLSSPKSSLCLERSIIFVKITSSSSNDRSINVLGKGNKLFARRRSDESPNWASIYLVQQGCWLAGTRTFQCLIEVTTKFVTCSLIFTISTREKRHWCAFAVKITAIIANLASSGNLLVWMQSPRRRKAWNYQVRGFREKRWDFKKKYLFCF